MHIDRLGLVSHFYGILVICITTYLGSWAGATALCVEVRWHCTVSVSTWRSSYQFPGCEYSVKRSLAPLRRPNSAYLCIYGHIQPYIHVFT